MKVNILTIFPEMFAPLRQSMLGRAIDNGILEISVTDIRDYTLDKHNRVDDTPYGGGAGMVMQVQPVLDAFRGSGCGGQVIYMSPRGEMLSGELAREIAAMPEITILCGHYEGVDQRALDALKAREIVKGRVLENSMLTPREACEQLAEACGAEPVQVIGSKFVLYKRNNEKPGIKLVK